MLSNLGSNRERGDQVVNQIGKGGVGFLKSAASFVGLYYIQLHINAANRDLAKSNNAGGALKLKQVNMALKNDGSLMYGLGQRISQVARNNSAPMHSHSREQLSALGTTLKNLALASEGVRANSTSNTAGASNSKVSK